MRKRERRGVRLAFLSGILILLGGGSGSAALYVHLLAFAARQVEWLRLPLLLLALVLPILAALGGITVMTGAFLYRDEKEHRGLLLIEIGSGAGLLGAALGVAGAVLSGLEGLRAVGGALMTLSGIGVLLSLVARGMIVSARLKR